MWGSGSSGSELLAAGICHFISGNGNCFVPPVRMTLLLLVQRQIKYLVKLWPQFSTGFSGPEHCSLLLFPVASVSFSPPLSHVASASATCCICKKCCLLSGRVVNLQCDFYARKFISSVIFLLSIFS